VSARFASNLAILAAGVVLVCCSLGMRADVSGWIGLGIGSLVLVATMSGFATRDRGVAQRVLDVPLAVLGAWTIVASRVFAPGATLKWLMFSSGAAAALLALAGLIAHELASELALRRAAAERRRRSAFADEASAIRVAS
jgi:hypothetical protein